MNDISIIDQLLSIRSKRRTLDNELFSVVRGKVTDLVGYSVALSLAKKHFGFKDGEDIEEGELK